MSYSGVILDEMPEKNVRINKQPFSRLPKIKTDSQSSSEVLYHLKYFFKTKNNNIITMHEQ